MLTCPTCKATLPVWAKECQFCKTDVSHLDRPKVAGEEERPTLAPQWVWGAYYSIAAYYLLSGAYFLVSTLIFGLQSREGIGFLDVLVMIVGGISAMIGLGLLLKVELIRGIVNFFCGMKIIFGLIGLAGSIFDTMFLGFIGVVFLILNIIDIATAAFMIYLIGETDRLAPNL